MIEEAINDDLFNSIANQSAMEIHILNILMDEEDEKVRDQWILQLDAIRRSRQEDGRAFLGVPKDLPSESFRTIVGEMGCTFKHTVIAYMHCLEIAEKYARLYIQKKKDIYKSYMDLYIKKAKTFKRIAYNIMGIVKRRLDNNG